MTFLLKTSTNLPLGVGRPSSSMVIYFNQILTITVLSSIDQDFTRRMDMGRSAYRTKEENPVSILSRDFYHSDDPTNRGANQGETNRKRILIVEDHDLSVMLLNDFLEVHGYEILKTGHGLEAIKLARDNKPDLILMDIQLPDLSGLDVTRVLKQDDQTKYIPVIAVTAFAMSG